MLSMKIGVMPGTVKSYEVEEGQTVGAILRARGYEVKGYELRLNGETVDENTIVDASTVNVSSEIRLFLTKQIKGNAQMVSTPKGVGTVVDNYNGRVYVEIGNKTYDFLQEEIDWNANAVTKAVKESKTNKGGVSTMKGIATSKFNIKDMFKIEKLDDVAMSMTGEIAIRNKAGQYINVSNDGTVTDVMVAMGEGSGLFMALPSPTVVPGDVIRVNGKYVKVIKVDDKAIKGITFEGKYTKICKIVNAFGLSYFQKVTSLATLDGANTNGFNPMMLLALADEDSEAEIDPMTLMAFSGAFNGQNTNGFNPMMLLALTGKMDLTTLMLMGGFNGQNVAGMNPMLLAALAGGDGLDTKSLLLAQAMGGQNLFGAPVAPKTEA